jgi:2-polyprenyl-6-methoxyphenol hydroxylase-like FAD-dependent oxidoreductase
MIIGAGPGGLTAAIALRRVGFEPIVFERAAALREIGSGLTLWPNALRALAWLDLDEPIRSISRSSGGMTMRTWRGDALFDMSAATLEQHFGGAGVALHRAELQALLLETLGAERVQLDHSCIGYQQDETGVTALFERGLTARGAILVGADGIKSRIRSQLIGASALKYAGCTVWRGIAEYPLHSCVGQTSMGPGSQFGFFPMTRDRVYWFGSANAAEGAPDQPGGRKRELIRRFQDWHAPIRALIEATDEAVILRNDIYDHDPLSRWSDGCVTLLGDAAHPITPNMGQGACLAIEDAVVLARCLEAAPNSRAALQAYQAQRMQRTASITLQSRRMGQIGQWRHPLVCWLRNQMIKRTPAGMRVRQLESMFQFEP